VEIAESNTHRPVEIWLRSTRILSVIALDNRSALRYIEKGVPPKDWWVFLGAITDKILNVKIHGDFDAQMK